MLYIKVNVASLPLFRKTPAQPTRLHFKACPRCNGTVEETDDYYDFVEAHLRCLDCGWRKETGELSPEPGTCESSNFGTLGEATIAMPARRYGKFGLWRLSIEYILDSMTAWDSRGMKWRGPIAHCHKVKVLANPFGLALPQKFHPRIPGVFRDKTGIKLVSLQAALEGEPWTTVYSKAPKVRAT
tara:strand:+ start:64 stop:618 length:555 start_codon:yes stop_codon:yes gene_type:complete